MKIDSHHHFWKYNEKEYSWIDGRMDILKTDYLPQNLSPLIKDAGFEGTIAIQARQSLEETEWLLNLSEENSFIKGIVGWVDLCSDKLEEQLEKYSSHKKFIGVRHVIQDEEDDNFMLRNDFIRGIGLLKKYNLTYDILIFARHLPQTIEFVRQFPDQTFILDHIAKPEIKAKKISPWKENMQQLASMQNVYCKLSGMVTETDWYAWTPDDIKPYLDEVVDAFGSGRLMIGSDWPVCLLAGEYQKVIQLVENYFSDYSENEKADIFGNTATRVYHL